MMESIKCVKCGYLDLGVVYRKDGIGHACISRKHMDGEHLDVVCKRCGYGWDQPTLDAKK